VVGLEKIFLKGGSTYSEFGLTLGTIIVFIKSSMKSVEVINWLGILASILKLHTSLVSISLFEYLAKSPLRENWIYVIVLLFLCSFWFPLIFTISYNVC